MWYCSNGLCLLYVSISFAWSSWGWLTLTNNEQIAEKYRPSSTLCFPVLIRNKDASNLGDIGLEVRNDGTVVLIQQGGQWYNTTDSCTVSAIAVWPCAAQVS